MRREWLDPSQIGLPAYTEMDGSLRNLKWRKIYPMLGGLAAGGYDYVAGKLGNEGIGCYVLPPNVATRIVKITGDVVLFEWGILGQGTFLCQRANGRVESFSHDDDNPAFVTYTQGDIVTWIAGEKGLQALTSFEPLFEDVMEEAVDIDTKEISPAFRKKYHAFKTLQG